MQLIEDKGRDVVIGASRRDNEDARRAFEFERLGPGRYCGAIAQGADDCNDCNEETDGSVASDMVDVPRCEWRPHSGSRASGCFKTAVVPHASRKVGRSLSFSVHKNGAKRGATRRYGSRGSVGLISGMGLVEIH